MCGERKLRVAGGERGESPEPSPRGTAFPCWPLAGPGSRAPEPPSCHPEACEGASVTGLEEAEFPEITPESPECLKREGQMRPFAKGKERPSPSAACARLTKL